MMYFVHVHCKGLMRTYILQTPLLETMSMHILCFGYGCIILCVLRTTENDQLNISYPEDSSDED